MYVNQILPEFDAGLGFATKVIGEYYMGKKMIAQNHKHTNLVYFMELHFGSSLKVNRLGISY